VYTGFQDVCAYRMCVHTGCVCKIGCVFIEDVRVYRMCVYIGCVYTDMGWLRVVGCLKL